MGENLDLDNCLSLGDDMYLILNNNMHIPSPQLCSDFENPPPGKLSFMGGASLSILIFFYCHDEQGRRTVYWIQ